MKTFPDIVMVAARLLAMAKAAAGEDDQIAWFLTDTETRWPEVFEEIREYEEDCAPPRERRT